jgi:NADPH-dependent glutamate synthase beta subunit-like oxidoreductase
MQLRLPVVVIGGGLTAIDTATESMAYYAVQVEKFLVRYESLTEEIGEDAIRANWDDYEREIAEDFLPTHARSARSATRLPPQAVRRGSSKCCVTGEA